MIRLNYTKGEGRRITYAAAFSFGRIVGEIAALGIDECYAAPLYGHVMTQLGDRGIFGTDRRGGEG